MTALPKPAPLAGLRVLDLTRVLAGPWCTMALADLGAEIIKIENPDGGDDTRHWGPPHAGGESAYYLCTNRNKKSITIDLSKPDGQRVVREIAARSDILVENYKLGGLDRFGLGYEALSAAFPRLIYCSISGYGRESPIADRPGYDYVIQAEAGLMAITGDEGGEPMKVGVAVADLFTGMTATQAVLAALIARDRDGVGQHIDIALFDCQLAMLANVGSAYLVSGQEPRRYGNQHPSVVPYQVFPTEDGRVVVAVGNDRQFRFLCKDLLDRPDLAQDPRFSTNLQRSLNRDALIPLLLPLFAARPTEYWVAGLRRAGVPTGEVRPVSAALTAPETLARGMVRRIAHPTAGEISLIASALRLSATPVVEPIAPPCLGEHTDTVLRDLLGFDEADIAALRSSGAIGPG